MEKYPTNTRSDPRRRMRIVGYPRKIRLAVPFSLLKPNSTFSIGSVRFAFLPDSAPFIIGNTLLRALDPIPASWFVDLQKDTADESDL